MKHLTLGSLAAVLILVGAGCSTSTPVIDSEVVQTRGEASDITFTYPDAVQETKTWEFPGTLPEEQIANKQIRITTTKGDIVFQMFADTAPLTVSNFVYLTTGGLRWTHVPSSRTRFCDPRRRQWQWHRRSWIRLEDELADDYTYERGIVAMVTTDQIPTVLVFIMLADTPLPCLHGLWSRDRGMMSFRSRLGM